MKVIHVVRLLGTSHLLTTDGGAAVASEIKKQLQAQPQVSVDLSGYELLSSAFLNHAFGQLCIDLNWDAKTFHERVSIVGMADDDLDELALDNAQMRRVLINKGQSPGHRAQTPTPPRVRSSVFLSRNTQGFD
jgi:hypothetical protein